MQAWPWYLISILDLLVFVESSDKQVLFAAFAGSPISIILSHDELYPALAPAVSRLWQQLALELSSHSLKGRESRGNQ